MQCFLKAKIEIPYLNKKRFFVPLPIVAFCTYFVSKTDKIYHFESLMGIIKACLCW